MKTLSLKSNISEAAFQDYQYKHHKRARLVIFASCIIYTIASIVFFIFSTQSEPSEKRTRHYLQPITMIDDLEKNDEKQRIDNGNTNVTNEDSPAEKASERLQMRIKSRNREANKQMRVCRSNAQASLSLI